MAWGAVGGLHASLNVYQVTSKLGLAGSKKTAAAAAGKPAVSAKRKVLEHVPAAASQLFDEDSDSDSDSNLGSYKVVLIVLLVLIRVYTASTTRKTIDTR